jgi:hypothetical protein
VNKLPLLLLIVAYLRRNSSGAFIEASASWRLPFGANAWRSRTVWKQSYSIGGQGQ